MWGLQDYSKYGSTHRTLCYLTQGYSFKFWTYWICCWLCIFKHPVAVPYAIPSPTSKRSQFNLNSNTFGKSLLLILHQACALTKMKSVLAGHPAFSNFSYFFHSSGSTSKIHNQIYISKFWQPELAVHIDDKFSSRCPNNTLRQLQFRRLNNIVWKQLL